MAKISGQNYEQPCQIHLTMLATVVDFLKSFIEQFSKTTAAKVKDRTSVIFHDKTTNGQNFSTKLQTALPNSLDHTS